MLTCLKKVPAQKETQYSWRKSRAWHWARALTEDGRLPPKLEKTRLQRKLSHLKIPYWPANLADSPLKRKITGEYAGRGKGRPEFGFERTLTGWVVGVGRGRGRVRNVQRGQRRRRATRAEATPTKTWIEKAHIQVDGWWGFPFRGTLRLTSPRIVRSHDQTECRFEAR